jgi:hypothetical protein
MMLNGEIRIGKKLGYVIDAGMQSYMDIRSRILAQFAELKKI